MEIWASDLMIENEESHCPIHPLVFLKSTYATLWETIEND